MADALDQMFSEMKTGAVNAYHAFANDVSDAAAQFKPAYEQVTNYDYAGLAKQIAGDLHQMSTHAQAVGRGLPPIPVMWDHAKQFISDAWSGLKTAGSNASTVPYSIQQTRSLPDTLKQANPYQGQ